LAVPLLGLLFASLAGEAPAQRGPGDCCTAPLGRDEGRRRQDLPRSRGTPVLTCSALRPRWDRATLAMTCARQPFGGPSVPRNTSAPTSFRITGLNHAACKLAVYASQGGLPHHHARLASGQWL